MVDVPVLVRVMDFLPPIPPTGTNAQLRLDGDIVAAPAGADPAPVRVTDCGLLPALSVNWSVALRVPDAVGWKTTPAEQVLPVERLETQELDAMEKSPAFVPVMATLPMVTGEPVELDRVADWEALAEPTVVEAKVRVVGLAVMLVEAAAPVPVSVTDCGLLPALSVN